MLRAGPFSSHVERGPYYSSSGGTFRQQGVWSMTEGSINLIRHQISFGMDHEIREAVVARRDCSPTSADRGEYMRRTGSGDYQRSHREFSIDQLIEHGVDIVGPSILITQGIGMLPHINDNQWFHSRRQGNFGIGGIEHLKRSAIENKPGPAAAAASAISFLQAATLPREASTFCFGSAAMCRLLLLSCCSRRACGSRPAQRC